MKRLTFLTASMFFSLTAFSQEASWEAQLKPGQLIKESEELTLGGFQKEAPIVLFKPKNCPQNPPPRQSLAGAASMPVLKPDAGIQHHLLVQTPDSVIYYHLRVKRP